MSGLCWASQGARTYVLQTSGFSTSKKLQIRREYPWVYDPHFHLLSTLSDVDREAQLKSVRKRYTLAANNGEIKLLHCIFASLSGAFVVRVQVLGVQLKKRALVGVNCTLDCVLPGSATERKIQGSYCALSYELQTFSKHQILRTHIIYMVGLGTPPPLPPPQPHWPNSKFKLQVDA